MGQDSIITETFMKIVTFVLSIFSCFNLFGQTKQYQNLLDTALGGHGVLFISSKPITHIQLDSIDLGTYFYFHHDYANKVLDTIMFAQIIHNSKSVDTTLWQDNELNNYILVGNRDLDIPSNSAIQKLRLTDKKQIKFIKKQINRYNSTDNYNRNLYYFSKPVFDNTKQFAIFQLDNGYGGLGGGGGIILYQFQGDNWKEIGIIMNWKY